MRHRIKKNKIRWGKDANKMILRKLLFNFLRDGKLMTTLKKAKIIKSYIDKIVSKSKEKNEANKNYLLKFLNNKKIVNFLFNSIGPLFSTVNGGYIRLVKLSQRESDGSLMAKLEWTKPVIIEEKKKPVKQLKQIK